MKNQWRLCSRGKHNLVAFAGENYSAWKFRIKSILRESGVMEAVDNDQFSNVKENATSEAKARAILISGVADNHLEYIKENTR